jgi:hypothetical protein
VVRFDRATFILKVSLAPTEVCDTLLVVGLVSLDRFFRFVELAA